jgi:hypothetical protein
MSSDVVVNMLTTPFAGGSGSQFPVDTISYFPLINERGSGSPLVSYLVGTEGVFFWLKRPKPVTSIPVFVFMSCTDPNFISEKLQLYWVQYGKFYKRFLSYSVL